MRKNHIDSIEDMEIRKGDMYLMEEKEVYGISQNDIRVPRMIRKIKIFRSENAQNLMDSVNAFIKNRDIIQIHYTTPAFCNSHVARVYDSVLIEYWEHEEETE